MPGRAAARGRPSASAAASPSAARCGGCSRRVQAAVGELVRGRRTGVVAYGNRVRASSTVAQVGGASNTAGAIQLRDAMGASRRRGWTRRWRATVWSTGHSVYPKSGRRGECSWLVVHARPFLRGRVRVPLNQLNSRKLPIAPMLALAVSLIGWAQRAHSTSSSLSTSMLMMSRTTSTSTISSEDRLVRRDGALCRTFRFGRQRASAVHRRVALACPPFADRHRLVGNLHGLQQQGPCGGVLDGREHLLSVREQERIEALSSAA